MILLLQFIAVVFAALSVWFWIRSAMIGWQKTDALPEKLEDGAFAFELEGGETIVWRVAKQGRLNSQAAFLTALAVMLQGVAVAFQLAQSVIFAAH